MLRRQFLSTACAGTISTALAAHGANPTSSKLRACIIGDSNGGGYGHDLHLAWKLQDQVEVVGLADPDTKGRSEHAAEAGALRTYGDYREMLSNEEPDLVAIGPRWTTHHKEYLLTAASVGAHGIMEKPLATDLIEGDAMIKAIEDKDLKWAIGFNIRGTEGYQHARRLILEEDLIGEVLEIRGRGKEDHRAGGEDLLVLGPHVLDIMIDLMGMPEWCSADIQMNGVPAEPKDIRDPSEPIGPIIGDRIHATFGFSDGSYGHFDTMKNKEGNGGRFGLNIYGTKGVVTMRWGLLPQCYVLHDSSWAPGAKDISWQPLPGTSEQPARQASEQRYQNIVSDLLLAIAEDREPAVSLQDGRDTLELIHAVFAAHFAGGRIRIPLQERAHPLMGLA